MVIVMVSRWLLQCQSSGLNSKIVRWTWGVKIGIIKISFLEFSLCLAYLGGRCLLASDCLVCYFLRNILAELEVLSLMSFPLHFPWDSLPLKGNVLPKKEISKWLVFSVVSIYKLFTLPNAGNCKDCFRVQCQIFLTVITRHSSFLLQKYWKLMSLWIMT